MLNLPFGVKDEVTASDPTDLITAHDFQIAYGSSEALQNVITREQLNAVAFELAREINKYPYSIQLYLALRNTVEGQKILQAALLLRVRAGDRERKLSKFPIYHHSLRVANSALEISQGIFKDVEKAFIDILGKLHDVVEDFGVTLEEIERIFGKDVAVSVMKMTTPSKDILARLYPEITEKFLPGVDTTKITKDTLNDLKQRDLRTFILLTAKLKSQFKKDRGLGEEHSVLKNDGFNIYNLSIKDCDGLDVLLSDMQDIDDGAIVMFKSNDVAARSFALESEGVVSISTAKARLTLQTRTDYHQDAIMVQLDRLIKRAEHDTPEANRLMELRYRFNARFIEVSTAFESYIMRAEAKAKCAPGEEALHHG